MAYVLEREPARSEALEWIRLIVLVAVALILVFGVLASDAAIDFDFGTPALQPGAPESVGGGPAAYIQEAAVFGETVAPGAEILPPHLVESAIFGD